MMRESLQSRIGEWEAKAKEQLEKVLDDDILRFQPPELKPQVADKLERIKQDVGNLKTFISTAAIPTPNQSPDHRDRRQSVAEELADIGSDEDKILEADGELELSAVFESQESSRLKKYLLSLTVFPAKTAIKKRPLIYWWMGEGLVKEEIEGDNIFEELLKKGYIRPTTTTSFTVYPPVRRFLMSRISKGEHISNGEQRALLGPNHTSGENEDQLVVTVLNVGQKYLGTKLENSLTKWRKLQAAQLGRWQDSATHHIEAEQDFDRIFDALASQKQLKYLSLRGISRIETLPRSIKKLTTLEILDLRACHNLEKLPREISELKKLTHLDVSECYLLDSMPKGLERLSHLQVLKGFVVSDSCKIRDVAQNLKKLRKLSMRVGNQGKDKLAGIGDFKDLKILTISWGSVSPHQPSVSLPQSLIKLDLRSVPFEELPEWLKPDNLTLERFYIKGGNPKLRNLNFHHYPKVKCLRISYLNGLQTHPQD
ncbi:hypothetical protein C2S51_027802 [Perilla frutescens var. frutescens]|nr:hypothetical protein C2S51_027802 [Perilla frutescens var. frutescens]